MRFEAPARESVPAATFFHPAYAGFPHAYLLRGQEWPALTTLNEALDGARHVTSGHALRFVAQTPALLADCLHYEARIFETGKIATRKGHWHDLFNALMWLDRGALKCAVNTAYVQEIRAGNAAHRSRPQYALTHFDEAGAVVILRDRSLLTPWDAHDWHGLLWIRRAQWARDARVILFGHALLEHFLVPEILPVAKCLVVVDQVRDDSEIMEAVASAIANLALLRDPQDLRPLPLVGLDGWHCNTSREDFYRTAPCFRPLRAGRRYPNPG
jgi:Protein of unknown function (DUF3025)